MTTFKVDDIVSVDLSPRYKDRLIGIVVEVIGAHPHKRGVKGELMWGVPWEGPYPIVNVYIPSIVGNDRGDDGNYYMTATHVKDGKLLHTNEALEAPKSKFSVGDRVITKNSDVYMVDDDNKSTIEFWTGTVERLPTINDASLSVVWDGGKDVCHKTYDRELVHLQEAETKRAMLLAVINDNEADVNTQLEAAMNALLNADKIMARNGTSLRVYLGAKKDVCERLTKVVHDTIPNVIREDD